MLYLAPLPIDFKNLDGVQKKIIAQTEAYTQKGISVTIITYSNGYINLIDVLTKKVSIKTKGTNKIDVINYTKKIIDDFDIFYIRYPLSDFCFIRLLQKIKRINKKIIVEIPTYPYDKEGNETIKGRIINLFDIIFRRILKKYVDRIVTFTGENEIFGIKTINTINGFDFNKVTPSIKTCHTNESINLIAVSAMYRVHGYDRLIKGIINYKQKGGKRNIVLHLVGEGDFIEHYKQLVFKGNISENVIFHGKVFGNSLYTLYDNITLGVNSLAIHRQNLKKESTLKTKEYAAMGLPIMSSSFVDAFSDKGNNDFVHMVPADESDIEIDKLISFVDNLYSKYETSILRSIIRKESYMICDITVTINPILDYIKKTLL